MIARIGERTPPALWAAHAVLSVAALNLHELEAWQVLRPLLVAILLTLLLQLALWAVLRSTAAVLLATLLVLLFFSYGHLYDLTKGMTLDGAVLGRHRYLLAAWVALAVFLGFASMRLSPASRSGLARFLSVAALAALLIPVGTFALFAARPGPGQPWQGAQESSLSYAGPGEPPDIYYIIVDSYARTDVMHELFGFNNRTFEEDLEARGFYIAEESVPNHVATGFSVASSLNMDYIPNLGLELPPGSYPGPLIDPIRSSAVRRHLESLGYRTIATSSGWAATSLIDADIYLTPERTLDASAGYALLPPINSFESLLLETTLLRAPLDLLQGRQTTALLERLTSAAGSERHRRLVLATFHNLETIPELDGPKFVFVHIVSPHRPYVFGPEGELPSQSGPFTFEDTAPSSDAAEEFAEYRDQLLFINDRILDAVDAILRTSDADPIIVLQSDTGPAFGFDWSQPDPTNLELKTAIFNAYRLPVDCQDHLYPQISPVNSFRVVFNCVLGGDFPLLADYTLFTDHHRRDGYDFRPVDRTDFSLDRPVGE